MSEVPPPRIRRLPPEIANQIAAGEVVERPSSVAKELLENSLDAGAGRIEIEIEAGGVRLLRVRDDGHGICAEDLAVALDRHATSKLHSASDLGCIRSLGFRGEALPAIASVSRLSITSRIAGSRTGWRIASGAPEPAGHPPGTTVEVRDLFFNTPARRRFLRTERTEARHVEDVVRRIALAADAVSVTFVNGARRAFSAPAAREQAARERRLATLCGEAFVQAALRLDFDGPEMRIGGWTGSPGYSRGQSDLQHFFVNGRMVRDSLLAHAVRQAYQDLVAQGRHPGYVLYLEVDPAAVDVNVHPAKHAVRFREARLVHDFVLRSLRRALTPELSAPPAGAGRGAGATVPAAYAALGPASRASAVEDSAPRPAPRMPPATPVAGAATAAPDPLGRPLGRVGTDHLVAGDARTLVVVDLRAATRAVCRARLRAGLASGGIRCRPLLIPMPLEVGEGPARWVEDNEPRLSGTGFDLRRSGPAEVLLRGVPAALAGADPRALAEALLRAGAGALDASGAPTVALLCALAEAASRGAMPEAEPALSSLLRELEALDLLAPETGTGEPGAGRAWVRLDAAALASLLRGR